MSGILEINEDGFTLETPYKQHYDGFNILTEDYVYHVGVDSDMQCCEVTGYIVSHDNLHEFVGASLLGINVVDKALGVTAVALANGEYSNSIFVNAETTSGTFQMILYNDHNGYYGHDVKIVKDYSVEFSSCI